MSRVPTYAVTEAERARTLAKRDAVLEGPASGGGRTGDLEKEPRLEDVTLLNMSARVRSTHVRGNKLSDKKEQHKGEESKRRIKTKLRLPSLRF